MTDHGSDERWRRKIKYKLYRLRFTRFTNVYETKCKHQSHRVRCYSHRSNFRHEINNLSSVIKYSKVLPNMWSRSCCPRKISQTPSRLRAYAYRLGSQYHQQRGQQRLVTDLCTQRPTFLLHRQLPLATSLTVKDSTNNQQQADSVYCFLFYTLQQRFQRGVVNR